MQYEQGTPEDWIIAESENYLIKGAYENVLLYSKADNKMITCIGDFYGDPVDGIIDWNEQFCITVGCGYIIYYLKKPFDSYIYHKETKQWIEAGRNSNCIKWIKKVRQLSDNEIELTDENNNIEIIKVLISK